MEQECYDSIRNTRQNACHHRCSQYLPKNQQCEAIFLLDGHQSRLALPFLQYINTTRDYWVVCIGVPYGTAFWQVKDSKEQNGSFNIALGKAKKELVDFRLQKSLPGSLQSTDLIPLINKA